MSRYVLDKRASSFTVRVFPSGMLASFGHSPTIAMRDFSGEVRFSPERPEEASMTIKIQAGSFEVTDDIQASDRREIENTMNQSVLEIDKYPEISFESTRVAVNKIAEGRYQANVSGNLSLRDVTQALAVPAQVTIYGDTQRASGEFVLSQSMVGIKPIRVAGGALKLKDELKFRFEIVAQAQD